LAESHKLDPRDFKNQKKWQMEAKNCAKIPPILALNQPLDESLRPKSGKSRLNRNMAAF